VSKTQQLPVLPLSDVVVLPGMVVPVALDDAERQAVIDAAKAGGDDSVLLVPDSTASTPRSALSRRSSSSESCPAASRPQCCGR